MRRIHIVGAHRSGTTLMLDLLVTCFAVDGSCPIEMSIYDEPDRDDYELFVSKQPRDAAVIGKVLDVDPDLYVIYMVRDPRAVITSVNRLYPGLYFCNLRVWNECERAAAALEGHPRFIMIRYEDLVADADAQQARIERAFPFLERKHAFSRFHEHSHASDVVRKAMNDLRPISADRLDAWKQHLPRIKGQMLTHPGLVEGLIRRGYERDDAWTKLLDGVEPDFSKGRRADRIPIWQRFDEAQRNWFKFRRKVRALRHRRRRATRAQKADAATAAPSPSSPARREARAAGGS
jgi:hypothetical protein